MAALTQTSHISVGRAGVIGAQFEAISKYSLTGALVNADTITFSNLLPDPARFKVIDFEFWAPELDTNATPTMTFTIGDGTDADGYLTTKGGAVGLQNSLAGQLFYKGDGAIVGAAAATAVSRDVKITVTGAVATGATSGDIWVKVLCEAI